MTRFIAILCCACAIVGGFGAEPSAGTNSTLPTGAAVPPVPSPVEYFRKLLGMTAVERRDLLAGRSPESRKQIMTKVREYESLRPNVRELRLQATELRWYLAPLMKTPSTNRALALALIPPDDRVRVEARLKEWDRLPPQVQQELLDNEVTIRYFTELQERRNEGNAKTVEAISPARREKLEAGIQQWRNLPETERRKIMARFNRFFELTPEEKQRALTRVSEPERDQIDKTLRSFGRLPSEQRAECIRSFEKFTSLSLAERQEFLRNADRWKTMSPDERQAWRDLVARLSGPPLPPGFNYPPLPPRVDPKRQPPGPDLPVVTNSQGPGSH